MDKPSWCQGAGERCPHPVAWRLEQTDHGRRTVTYIELCAGHTEALRAEPTFAVLLRDGVVRALPVTSVNSH